METAAWYNKWLFSLIKPFIEGDILEAGGGIGNFTRMLATCGNVVSIDNNKDYVKKLKQIGNRRITAGFGDIDKGEYFFRNKKFNTVVCLNVLEHIEEDTKVLANMYKLIKSGGKLILLVPAHKGLYGRLDRELGHFRRYSKERISRKLRDSGFVIQSLRYLNMVGAVGWYLNSRVLKKKILPKNQLALFDQLSRPLLLLERSIEPPFGLSIFTVAEKQ
jgi:SAM-dependent methyltransferase